MIQPDREWAAVQHDRILLIRETKEEAEKDAEDLPTGVTDIIALPKNPPRGPI